jgi:hypothetical protein
MEGGTRGMLLVALCLMLEYQTLAGSVWLSLPHQPPDLAPAAPFSPCAYRAAYINLRAINID